MNYLKKVLGLSLVLLVMVALAACGGSDDESDSAQGDKEQESETEVNTDELEIGKINWAENIAVTNMWKAILEDKGYNVTLTQLDMGFTMKALENGDLDASLEVWLPVQDANYLEEYQDTVNFSDATWFDNAKVGLIVPSYVEEVDSIEDLNEHKDMFDGEIVGFDPGAGTMEVTKQLIEDYDLDFELLPSTEPTMLTEIGESIKSEEPIVAPLWTPHWIFSEYDLKFLEDPQNVYGGVEKIHHATRTDFADDYPKVSEYFKNWKMDDEQIGDLINYVENAEEPLEGAKDWVNDNQDVVDEWLQIEE
ncbi:glycine betaine ABC transporter substrate-binding protein [Aquisalibacillus elongatus]|uniref:Glycine betaine/proline transport system substrate-binding protein n=1 Tax=Aquisalibacillus elongatus TaxID=485577 RepID=A0A3N5C9J5_9BACI|nr:glycine betaine ABC transporter substrate-binding protein [Aquisalibacillus elongatus]RPF55255.1 glycine betaine/proline transport system substrate-binding protein [Aquisalibacillus elongatus]